MSWADTLRTGLDAIRSHRLRSGLTMLGILIGIAAVILTVGLGIGAQRQVSAQVQALGTNLLIVSPGSSTGTGGVRGGFGSASTLTQADAEALGSRAAAPGETVAADSSTATIEVIGAGPQVVTVSVDVTKIPSVKAGQRATVRPDGGTGTLPATVTSVGVAPSAAGGTAYPVTLSFTGTPPDIRDGIGAAATITTAQAQNALAVPTTAVTRTAAGDFVTVLADGKTRRTPVRVGAVGTDYTQISQGITAGTVVVLANLDEAVPSSSTTTRFGPRAGFATRGG